jgi:glycosyltransferase involved in cell wall biosynthesis
MKKQPAVKDSNDRQLFSSPTGMQKSDVVAGSATPIIVHCHLRWDFVWQRPQQIFSRLASNRPILFVEEPCEAIGSSRLDVSEPMTNVVRVVPHLERCQSMSVDQQCEEILALLLPRLSEDPMLRGRFEAAIQWFYSPMTAPAFLGRFGANGVVYDCMDELANFRFAPPDIAQRERFLLQRADLVFTGGYQLYEAKSRFHANTHFYGCGVDVQHFGRARAASTLVPPELAALPHPIFGYFGVIDERLDYALLAGLAGAYPQASIVMVGPLAKVEQKMLPSAPNIHWLGQRAYDDLPAFVKGFDVCLMPFALNEATRYINPTKTLEYLAAGKPVLSTAVPDVVHHFSKAVCVVRSHEEFVREAGAAADHPDPVLIARGVERASQASWSSIVGAMSDHLARIVPHASRPLPAAGRQSKAPQAGIDVDRSPESGRAWPPAHLGPARLAGVRNA